MGVSSKWLNYEAQMDANNANREIAKQTNETNLQLAREQNAWNREEREIVQKYNEPVQQVKRLQDAGLSAAAAAQSAGNFESQPMQSADLANQQTGVPMVAPHLDEINILGIMRQAEELASIGMDNMMKAQDVDLHNAFLLSDLDAKQWAVRKTMQDYQQSGQSFPYRIDSLKADIKSKDAAAANSFASAELLKANREKVKQDFEFAKDLHDLDIKRYVQEIANLAEQQKKIKAETSKVQQDTATSKSQQALLDASKEKVVSEKEGVELDNINKEFGAPTSVTQRLASMLASGKITEKEINDSMEGIQYILRSGDQYFNKYPETILFLHEVYDEGRAARGEKNPSKLGPWLDTIEKWTGIKP